MLILGCGRSGTSIFGELFEAIPSFEYLEEPYVDEENIRMFPVGSPPYKAVYRERNDSESINRRVDDHLPLGRARSCGWQRQLLDLLAHNHVVNSIARHRYGPEGTHGQQSQAA